MKILYILNEIKFSGLEMMLLNSSSEWAKYDITIDVLATGENIGEASQLFINNGYKVIHISFKKKKLNAFFTLRKHLKSNNYDIIHNHTEANFLLNCLNSFLTGHFKIVHTFHSVFRWTLLGTLKRRLNRLIAKVLRVKYIAVSKSVAENEKKFLNTKPTIIYNWFNNSEFTLMEDKDKAKIRDVFKIPINTFLITTVGNCSPIKRHELILEALASLPPSIDWQFIHIGHEQNNNERNKAKDLGILEKCRFVGESIQVKEMLAISDLYVMSSVVEGFSIATLEAIGSGVPTILLDVPGLKDVMMEIPEIISAKSDGKDLGSLIEKFYRMPSNEKRRIGEIISQKCHNLFSMEKRVYEYFKFYRDL